MDKTRKGIVLIVVVVGIATVPFVIYGPDLFQPIPEFYWGVDVGDTFLYNVTFYPDTYHSITYYGVELVPFNRTFQIQVEIIFLPSFSDVTDRPSFENEVLNPRKVSCTILNGDAPHTSTLFYSTWLSFVFLPLGGWEWIDGTYPEDSTPENWVDDTLIRTRLYSDSLWIQKNSYMLYDEVVGTAANVSLSNGVPTFVTHYDIVHEDISSTIFEFTLVSSDLSS